MTDKLNLRCHDQAHKHSTVEPDMPLPGPQCIKNLPRCFSTKEIYIAQLLEKPGAVVHGKVDSARTLSVKQEATAKKAQGKSVGGIGGA